MRSLMLITLLLSSPIEGIKVSTSTVDLCRLAPKELLRGLFKGWRIDADPVGLARLLTLDYLNFQGIYERIPESNDRSSHLMNHAFGDPSLHSSLLSMAKIQRHPLLIQWLLQPSIITNYHGFIGCDNFKPEIFSLEHRRLLLAVMIERYPWDILSFRWQKRLLRRLNVPEKLALFSEYAELLTSINFHSTIEELMMEVNETVIIDNLFKDDLSIERKACRLIQIVTAIPMNMNDNVTFLKELVKSSLQRLKGAIPVRLWEILYNWVEREMIAGSVEFLLDLLHEYYEAGNLLALDLFAELLLKFQLLWTHFETLGKRVSWILTALNHLSKARQGKLIKALLSLNDDDDGQQKVVWLAMAREAGLLHPDHSTLEDIRWDQWKAGSKEMLRSTSMVVTPQWLPTGEITLESLYDICLVLSYKRIALNLHFYDPSSGEVTSQSETLIGDLLWKYIGQLWPSLFEQNEIGKLCWRHDHDSRLFVILLKTIPYLLYAGRRINMSAFPLDPEVPALFPALKFLTEGFKEHICPHQCAETVARKASDMANTASNSLASLSLKLGGWEVLYHRLDEQ